jgi:hypothetical protein
MAALDAMAAVAAQQAAELDFDDFVIGLLRAPPMPRGRGRGGRR